jgi:hypothetical protein
MSRSSVAARLGIFAALAFCLGAGKPAVPEAAPDFALAAAGQSVLVDVLANDTAVGPSRRLLKVFKPGYGKAAIENGRVRYTPAPGFVGSDQFDYMVQSEGSQPRIGSVNVEVGGGGVAMQLRGQVIDDEVPYATVQALVAGFSFLSVSDGHGNYVLDIAAPAGSDMVTLKATGVSATGSPVEFVSLLGEAAPLDAAAGTDGILTLDENYQVNLTHFSTAQYVLLTAASGGVPPSTDATLRQLAQSLDLSKLVEYATVVKLIVDDFGGVDYQLPAGVESVLALLQDPQQLAAFEDSVDPSVFAAARTAVTEDTASLSGFSALPVPGRYALLFPSVPGTIAVNQAGQSFVDLSPALPSTTTGRGSWLFNQFITDPGADWAVEGDRIRVYPDHVYTMTLNYPNPNCPELGPTLRVSGYVDALVLERLDMGVGVDYLGAGTDLVSTAIEPLAVPGCAVPAVGSVFSFTEPTLGLRDGAGEIPYGDTEALGVQMLQVFRQFPSGQSYFGTSLFDFDADDGPVPAFCTLAHHGVLIDGGGTSSEFCWQLGDGHLRTELIGGDGLVYSYTYRRYQTDGRKGEGLLATISRQAAGDPATTENVTAFAMASRQDGSLAFTPSMVPGRWASGLQSSLLPSQNPSSVVVNYRLCESGLAEFESINSNTGAHPYSGRWSWTIEDGHFWMRAYVDDSGTVGRCSFSDPACGVFREREWVPVAADGDRIYVIERRYELSNDVLTLINEYPNFLDRNELTAPERCTNGSIPAN